MGRREPRRNKQQETENITDLILKSRKNEISTAHDSQSEELGGFDVSEAADESGSFLSSDGVDGESGPDEQDSVSDSLSEELLRIEERNKKEEKEKDPRPEASKASTTIGASRILTAMYRDGSAGEVMPSESCFLSVFENGLESAYRALREESEELLRKAREEFKGKAYRSMNKQKPAGQRIKQNTAEKLARMENGYLDLQFVADVTKDYRYRTGMHLSAKKRSEKDGDAKYRSKKEVKTTEEKVHEKMKGFYTPTAEYLWEDRKITEFVACIFME